MGIARTGIAVAATVPSSIQSVSEHRLDDAGVFTFEAMHHLADC